MCSKITFLHGTLWHCFCFLNPISNFSYQANVISKNVCICLAPFPFIYLLVRTSFMFCVLMSLWTPYSFVAKVSMDKLVSLSWYAPYAKKYVAYSCAEECSAKRKGLDFQAVAVEWSRGRSVGQVQRLRIHLTWWTICDQNWHNYSIDILLIQALLVFPCWLIEPIKAISYRAFGCLMKQNAHLNGMFWLFYSYTEKWTPTCTGTR